MSCGAEPGAAIVSALPTRNRSRPRNVLVLMLRAPRSGTTGPTICAACGVTARRGKALARFCVGARLGALCVVDCSSDAAFVGASESALSVAGERRGPQAFALGGAASLGCDAIVCGSAGGGAGRASANARGEAPASGFTASAGIGVDGFALLASLRAAWARSPPLVAASPGAFACAWLCASASMIEANTGASEGLPLTPWGAAGGAVGAGCAATLRAAVIAERPHPRAWPCALSRLRRA